MKLGQSLEQSGEYHNKSKKSLKRIMFVELNVIMLSPIIVENLLVIN